MDGLFDRFANLHPAAAPGLFDAIRLSDARMDFLSKTSEGAPIVLLQDSSTPKYRPGFQLKYLKAEFHTTCLIRSDKGEANGQFAIVSCDANVPELHEMFVRSVAASITDLSISAGTDEIQSLFQRLADLFRQFSKPGCRELTGLWAELFVIARSKHISSALHAWRNESSERFDFSWMGGQLEVKATTKAVRAHDFALEQLQSPENGKSFVASFLLQQLSGGPGIMDLASSIEQQVSADQDLRLKLWNNIASDLGNDFSEAMDRQFDASYAARNAVLYMAEDIPAPLFRSDPRITSVRFMANLVSVHTTATDVTLETIFV